MYTAGTLKNKCINRIPLLFNWQMITLTIATNKATEFVFTSINNSYDFDQTQTHFGLGHKAKGNTSPQIYLCSRYSTLFIILYSTLFIIFKTWNSKFFHYQRKRPDKLSVHLRIWPGKTYFWPDIVRWPAIIFSPVTIPLLKVPLRT